jgi:hypothetical protein
MLEFNFIDELDDHGSPEDLINFSVCDDEFDESSTLGRFNKFR